MHQARRGFTLIELITFTAIFAVAVAAFGAVFMNIAGVQVRQSSVAEVQSQSQFILQTVQYYVERSSLVDAPADTATTTLTLRMASSSEDPAVFSFDNGALQLSTGGGAANAITSPRVVISDLEFVKRANPGGHDSVSVSFTVSYDTDNPQQMFSHALQTAVTRVSAATFDSDIVPAAGAGGDWSLGNSAGDWRSINDTIYFSGSNVGIGVISPAAPLQVDGNIYLSDSGTGIILRNGSSCYLTTVSAGGVLVTATTTCP